MIIHCKGTPHEVLFDEDDRALVEQYHWNIINDKCKSTSYVRGYLKGHRHKSKPVFMHRLIMGLDGPIVDHINRNGLDNRRVNLRHITKAGNARNSVKRKGSMPRGVREIKKRKYYYIKKYQAHILKNGVVTCIGEFNTPEEASAVYEAENKKLIAKEIL